MPARQKNLQTYEELSSLGQELFSFQWKGIHSDWDAFEQLAGWIVSLYCDIENAHLMKGLVDFLSQSHQVDGLKGQAESLQRLLERQIRAIDDVTERPPLQHLISKDTANISLERQRQTLTVWRSQLDALQHLVRFNQLTAELQKKHLGPLIQIALEWDKGADTLLRAFEAHWYRGLVEQAYLEQEPLKHFDRTQHEHMRQEFCRLDKQLLQFNQRRLAYKHWENVSKLGSGGELNLNPAV